MMTGIDHDNAIIDLCLGLAALMTVVLTWLRWVRPRLRTITRRWTAALDTIAGREAVRDSITDKELAPALPSIGARMEAVEGGVLQLVEIVRGQHKQDERLDDHEHRINQLEGQSVERIVGKAESAAAWNAMAAVAQTADPALDQAHPFSD